MRRFADWEVRDILETMSEDMAEAASNPAVAVSELLHRAAYSGGLANALLPDASALGRLSGESLAVFVGPLIKANNVVIAAAGVDLAQLQQVCVCGLGRGSLGVCVSVCVCMRMRVWGVKCEVSRCGCRPISS